MTPPIVFWAYLDAIRFLGGFCGMMIAWSSWLHLSRKVPLRESPADTNALKWLLLGLGCMVLGDTLFLAERFDAVGRETPLYHTLLAAGWTLLTGGLMIRFVSRAQSRGYASATIIAVYAAAAAVSYLDRLGVL